MDAFDPENDLIDRHLRGELHGKQLESFMRKLESDPELKKEVAFRELLVRGIQDQGSAQLKNYLRQRTSQKRGLRIGYKSWYYAAAAVGIILVCSVVVLVNINKSNSKEAGIVKQQESIQATPPATGIPSGPSISEPKENPSNPEIGSIASNERGIEEGNQSNEMPAFADAVDGEINNSSNIITVASNIQVIPIKIDSPIERVTMAKAEKDIPIARNSKRASQDSGYDEDAAEMVKSKLANANTKFKLNFYNTKDATPQVDASLKDLIDTEIKIYNLPYDNPLLFTYQNKMYLRTGNKYYEIDANKDGNRKVTAISDQALLKVLSQ